MAFQITNGEDVQIKGLITLIYGEPGVGKTSLALSANKPIIFDFDNGVHRSEFKKGKQVVRVTNWSMIDTDLNNLEKNLAEYQTIIIDTIDTNLKLIRMFIEDSDYKMKINQLKMYGKLIDIFENFLNRIVLLGKNVILIAHETTEEKNGMVKTVPKITGSSKDIVRNQADLVGYIRMINNTRVIDFNPTDFYIGKNPAHFNILEIPSLTDEPNYFENKLLEARTKLQQKSKEQEDAIDIITSFSKKIYESKLPDEFLALMAEMGSLNPGIKKQLWVLKLKPHTEQLGYTFDGKEMKFHKKAVAVEILEPAMNGTNNYSFE